MAQVCLSLDHVRSQHEIQTTRVWPCLASKIPRDCVRSPWQSEVFTGRDFQTGCIGCTLRFATVAQVAQSMLSHWAQLHGRWDKVRGLRSLASLPITGRRWTSEPQRRLDRNRLGPNGFKWIQVLQMLRAYPMPIPCPLYLLYLDTPWTPLGHPVDTPWTPLGHPSLSSFSESFSHLATATSHWTPGPDNDRRSTDMVDLRSMCYAVLRRPAKFGTEPTHLRKWRRSRTAMWCCKDPMFEKQQKTEQFCDEKQKLRLKP